MRMITNQPSYVGDSSGEVVTSNTSGEPMIPTQRGAPDDYQPAPKDSRHNNVGFWVRAIYRL